LRLAAERLREFPYSGQVVPELGREELREVIQGNYRVIYRVGEGRIDILTVYHGARLLNETSFDA
jgi:toxin ParE1/3/4